MIRLLSALLVIIGACGFFLPLGYQYGLVQLGDKVEFPNSVISDLGISSSGAIFIGSGHWGRIQKYSPSGSFIRGWKVVSSGGMFCMDVGQDKITIFDIRRDAVDIYDFDGSLLSADFRSHEYENKNQCTDKKMSKLFQANFYGLSVKSVQTDQKEVFISRRIWHYLFLGPFYSLGAFLAGLILIPSWRRAV